MKTFLLTLTYLLASLPMLQAQTADETAIKQVIEAETRAWNAADMAAFQACWHIQPYSVAILSLLDGTHVKLTSEMMKAPNQEVMGGRATAVNTNYQIGIMGNSAWSSHDQVTTAPNGQKSYTHELRMLEKINGAWKITGISVHEYKP
jgi:hypothetical protein